MFLTQIDPAFLAGEGGGTPSLDLFFSATKALDSRITFTRASVGTYIDSAGLVQTASSGTARFTHDPLTLASLGLLVEESRANLVPWSEEFSQASWSKYLGTVSANNGTAPDGNTTADLIYPSSTGSLAGQVFRSISGLSSGNVVTASCFVKAAGKTFAYLSQITNTFGPSAYYNLTTGAITNISAGCTATMQQLGNGWWRITLTSTVGTGTNYAVLGSVDNAGSTTNTASGTNGILAWGYQTEVGSFVTSYIPTDGTAGGKTRAADVATMTGTNFSAWYNASEGTMVSDYQFSRIVGSSEFPRLFTIQDSTFNDFVRLFTYRASDSQHSTNAALASGGVTYGNITLAGGGSNTAPAKAGISFTSAVLNVAQNGSLATDSSIGVTPSVDRLYIGSNSIGTNLNGTISRLRFYRRCLPNASLQTLTT